MHKFQCCRDYIIVIKCLAHYNVFIKNPDLNYGLRGSMYYDE